MKASTLSRSVELAKLALKLGLNEFRSGDIKSRIEQATLIAKSLSNLKGAAMKAGQLLSLDLNHYFPPEAIQILSQLQNSAVALPYKEIEVILKKEFSKVELAQLKNIDPQPLGVASIGQVHKARYDKKDVVLKIQYPEVADSIDSDLKILKTIAVSFCQMTGRKMDLEPLFSEFRTLLEQEVNYKTEAQFQKKYQDHILKLKPNNIVSYRVPDVIAELSTAHVLTMSYEKGVSLRAWLATEPTMELKKHLAHAILDLYFHEFFEWGLVQTDPNWGNFLIEEQNSKIQLTLLDFGATRKYKRSFIQNYIKLLNYAADQNFVALKKHAVEFGLIDARESEAAFIAFEQMLTTAIKPFFIKNTDSKNFDFSDKNHSLQSNNAAKALSDELTYSPPPYELVFLHRKLAGVYSILKSLGVQLDISSYWQKMADFSSYKGQP